MAAAGADTEAAQASFANGPTGTAYFPFRSISCGKTFRFIWYSNFMNYISPISFVSDRLISSLIIVYLENAFPVYMSLFHCLPFYFPFLEFSAELR